MRTILGFSFLASLILGGCTDKVNKNVLVGEVAEVRVLEKTEVRKANDKSGNAAIGALVGGALTGGLGGAAIGAAVGASGGTEVVKIEKLVGCRIKATLSDGKDLIFFFNQYSSALGECALLKKGDKISVSEETFRGSVAYFWKTARASVGSQ